jgi:hypothetical protein
MVHDRGPYCLAGSSCCLTCVRVGAQRRSPWQRSTAHNLFDVGEKSAISTLQRQNSIPDINSPQEESVGGSGEVGETW